MFCVSQHQYELVFVERKLKLDVCGVCGVGVHAQPAMEYHTAETWRQLRHVTLVELLDCISPWNFTEFLLEELVPNLTLYVLVDAFGNINVKFFAVHLCLETGRLAAIQRSQYCCSWQWKNVIMVVISYMSSIHMQCKCFCTRMSQVLGNSVVVLGSHCEPY